MIRKKLYAICNLIVITSCISVQAQENIVPMNFNGGLKEVKKEKSTAVNKTSALTLPFFEDFTDYSSYPDNTKWADIQVHVNNTMCVSPVSRGVATFDGLNANGIPYQLSDPSASGYADSLTSLELDLSASLPSDSIYFSFFYQPQGNGFYPEAQDSLMLYFKKSNDAWVKVWSKAGTVLDSFKPVMIAITDTVYMHTKFQFRFVNIASLNTNDDVWNIDYIRLEANRNINDTLVNDVAFTMNPSFILNDYTYMPYRQFIADINKERATQHQVSAKNGYNIAQSITYGYTAREKGSGTPLFSSGLSNMNIAAGSTAQFSFPMYTNTVPSTALYDNFNFENKYFIQSVSGTDKKVNDTIVREQIFHNFLAYDDGSAEKAYFLKLFPTLPGKLAIEYHLNQSDTIMGVSIYFGRQVPLAFYKYFSVAVYKSISTTGGSDQVVYQEDFLIPAYQRNDFTWTYKFAKPIPIDKGTFYIGTIQPALSNSDSLYLGLDVNRVAANHLYYNVVGYWQPSTISGAIMIRPILGQIIASGITGIKQPDAEVVVTPNPVADFIHVKFEDANKLQYTVVDIQGKRVLGGEMYTNDKIDVSKLVNGVYFLKLQGIDKTFQVQKIIKY